jgi:hypothetical protein
VSSGCWLNEQIYLILILTPVIVTNDCRSRRYVVGKLYQ